MRRKRVEERLIGVFLTTESLDLFDFDSYLKDNISDFSGGEIKLDGNTDKYQGRLYAELRQKTLTNTETGEKLTTEEYVFPDLKVLPIILPGFPPLQSMWGIILQDQMMRSAMVM